MSNRVQYLILRALAMLIRLQLRQIYDLEKPSVADASFLVGQLEVTAELMEN